MAAKNGKSDDTPEVALDVEHELPPAEVETGHASSTAAEFQKLQQENAALYDRLARLQAEFDNFRKRSQREQVDFREYAVADAAKLFLPVVDSLERALAHAEPSSELHSGLELVQRQFLDALQKVGVRPIAAEGEPFDPALHQAVEMVETRDVPDHHVLDELQRGYKIKERLLRPAMVRVARNPEG
jgi:molecular chaperone GrpE